MKTTAYLLLTGLLILSFQQLTFAGNALEFDGNNDYVSLDHQAMNGLSDCTVEYCVYLIREETASSIISGARDDAGNNEYLHYFEVINGFRPHIRGQAPVNGPRFPDREWFHFALTRNGDNGLWIAYINGEEEGRGNLTAGALSIANNGLVLGQDQDAVGGRFDILQALHGMIDEMRIWNFIRSEDEIRQTMRCMVSEDSEGLVAYYRFDEQEGQVLHDLTENEYHGRLGSNDGQDNADPRWVESEAEVYGGVIVLSSDYVDFGPVVQGEPSETQLLIANIAEEDDEWHALSFTLTDMGEDPDWLEIQDEEGVVEVGDTLAVNFTASTEGLELGEYERTIRLNCNAANVQVIEIPVYLFVVEGFGRLYGTVTDEENDEPIEEAIVTVDHFGYVETTNADGEYNFPQCPAWTFDLVIIKEDYLPMWEREVEINPGGEVERDIALLHAEFIPDPARIEFSLQPDDELEIPLNIRNGGNGPLTWLVERVFPEEMQIEPWEHRWHLPAAEVVDNSRLGGIAFVDDHFYVAGGDREEDNIIYVLNREGQLIRQFPQFAVSNYGIRDLTWDGQYLWGFDAGEMFGFTTEGELEARFRPPEGSIRGITWDPERNLLWICNITTDIYGIDRNGNLEITIDRPGDLHIYGLSWYPEDEDGFNLYMFCCDGENRRQVHKMDVNSGEFEIICEVDVEGRAGAATISGLWDPYSWVFIGLTQANPDAIEIWQLDARTEWLAINPVEGIIEPNEETELTVTLNTLGLPEEEEFTADLMVTHDGIGGVTEIPVNLMVTLEGGVSQRILGFDLGWNIVSLNVEPPDNDVRVIMQPLVEDDLLDLMKDGMGRFYNPAFDFNNIPFWNTAEGYQVKVSQECNLVIEGEVIPWNTPIPLLEGWQIVSYYPRDAVNAVTALSDIVDNLIIAKNASGRFYVPEFGFNGIGDMREGCG